MTPGRGGPGVDILLHVLASLNVQRVQRPLAGPGAVACPLSVRVFNGARVDGIHAGMSRGVVTERSTKKDVVVVAARGAGAGIAACLWMDASLENVNCNHGKEQDRRYSYSWS